MLKRNIINIFDQVKLQSHEVLEWIKLHFGVSSELILQRILRMAALLCTHPCPWDIPGTEGLNEEVLSDITTPSFVDLSSSDSKG